MATTLTTLSDNTYVQILAAADTAFTVQNVSNNFIYLRQDASQPTTVKRGHILAPFQLITNNDFAAGDYWVKNAGAGNAANLGTDQALEYGQNNPVIVITK